MRERRSNSLSRRFAVAILLLPGVAFADYKKIDPPPDADKVGTLTDLSCWLATAANMLAGAGYGTPPANVQERAEEIYEQLKTQFTVDG